MDPLSDRFHRWFVRDAEGSLLLDRLLPRRIREGDADVLRRGRLVILAAGAAAVWGPPFAVILMGRGAPEIGTIFAALTAVIALQPIVLRVTGSIVLAANLILAAILGIVLIAGAGGLDAPGLLWLVVIPIGGVLLAGQRSGVLWAGIAVATIGGVYFMTADAVPILQETEPESFRAVQALNLLAILSVITAMALRSFHEKDNALREMKVARDEAREAGEAKMRFVAAMSHEIRTPMNGALGLSDLLLTTDLSDEQRHLAEGIHRSGRALLSVIDDVLDMSWIESGRLPLDASDFALRKLLDDVQEIVREAARAKGLELACSVAPGVPVWLRGDAGRLRQVLLNLVGNAVKFTERGRVEMEVSLSLGSECAERALRFDVRDTGIGIPADRIEQIFDRFTQAEDSTRRRFGGTGLGLAISKQLTHLMGGEIGVQARAEGGSHFWFALPLNRSDGSVGLIDIPKSESALEASPSRAEVVATAAARILLAEDNPVNQQVGVAMLEMLGHRVELAGDGRQALEALERSTFDLVLMDCQMPELDGFEVTTRLRENEAAGGRAGESPLPRVPVVALTASAMQGDRERCLAAGMDDYLSKPLTLAQLGAALGKWLPEASDEVDEEQPDPPTRVGT
jgi:signal transduction histidine kinase/CheY-like chemotaxis protein